MKSLGIDGLTITKAEVDDTGILIDFEPNERGVQALVIRRTEHGGIHPLFIMKPTEADLERGRQLAKEHGW